MEKHAPICARVLSFCGWGLRLLHRFSVATPAEPRGEKKLFLVQILGGEKLLKFVEKCR